MDIKRKFILIPITLLTLLIAGCGQSTDTSGENASVNENASQSESGQFQEITESDFRTSLSSLKVTVDEFKGNYEIFPEGRSESLSKKDKMVFGLSSNVTRYDNESGWEFTLTSTYAGQDWMFHDEVDVKSDSKVISFPEVELVYDKVLDNGVVTEFGAYTMTTKEAVKFCEIINGKNIKFRLSGTRGDILEISGQMSTASQDNFKASCKVFAGILQGLKP